MQFSYFATLLSFHSIVKAATLSFVPTATSRLNSTFTEGEKAIVPTTSGQIGINPVYDGFGGPPETYIGVIQSNDTMYIEIQNITTHWIGVNTEYLSLVTVNPTSTSTVSIIIETATAAVNGSSIGDISVIFPEGLAIGLQNAATTAVNNCNVVAAKKGKRQAAGSAATACVLNIITDTITNTNTAGDLFGDVSDAAWESIEASIAPAADEVIQAAWALMKTKAQRAKFAALFGVTAVAIGYAVSKSAGDTFDGSSSGTLGKLNLPVAGVGAPIPVKGCDGTEEPNQDSPQCTDYDCQGTQTNKTCEVPGTDQDNCPCLKLANPPIVQYANLTFLNLQQSLILEVSTMTQAPSPYCLPFEDPHEGLMYCQCSDSKNYQIQATGTIDCPWTTVPPSSDLYTTSAPPPTITPQTDYTSSDYDYGTIWACPTSSTRLNGNFVQTLCESPSFSIGTFTGNLLPTTAQPPPTTSQPPPSVTSTAAQSSSSACDYGWCASPFCDPVCGPG